MKAIDFSYFIERFNAGEMDDLEKKWFMKEMDGNPFLQKEVTLRRKVDESLIKHDLISLRNKLANLEKTRKEQSTPSENKKAAIIRFAAALAILMLLGTIYYLVFRGSADSSKIFQSYMSPYEFSGSSRSSNTINGLTFQKGLDYYEAGSYTDAAAEFNLYLENNPGKKEVMLLLGISEIYNNNLNRAIDLLTAVRDDKDNLLIDVSQWYLSLCYIRNEQPELARRELEAIISSGSVYKQEARKALRDIK